MKENRNGVLSQGARHWEQKRKGGETGLGKRESP